MSSHARTLYCLLLNHLRAQYDLRQPHAFHLLFLRAELVMQVPGWRPALSLTCGGVVELFQRCAAEGQPSAHAGANQYERCGTRIGETLSSISGKKIHAD